VLTYKSKKYKVSLEIMPSNDFHETRHSRIDGVDLTDRRSITPYIFGEEILFAPEEKKRYTNCKK